MFSQTESNAMATLGKRICELFRIEHPVLLGGMAGATGAELVAAVSNAGGLGILGCARIPSARIGAAVEAIRGRTERPFGLNLLLFSADELLLSAVLECRAPVFSTAWPWPEQDLRTIFARAHDTGAKVIHMVASVSEAVRAAEAGADAIAAQGTEGGGHVGLMGTMALVPQVVREVAPIPVVAAGGIATGEGLAAALALGAEGVLVGTRLLATDEAPLPDSYKQAIVASDGHDTVLTEIPDIANGRVWPGAWSRVVRNRFIAEWSGREGELRARRAEVGERIRKAFETGDRDAAALFIGQDAGLIDAIEPAGEIVRRLVRDAETILKRLAR
jgi:NAD(P)H-dependent flavin oxidoreductase YrpB (nitropropane dioxygenase family)